MINSIAIFFRNISGLRTHYGYSQKYMAQLLGIGVGSLRKIERGMIPSRLEIDIVFAVYKHFGISPSVLFSQELFPLFNDEDSV